ncbi:MAG: hypothetical protein J6J36_07580 [Clostridia bacterium]|nr:hypothetical protein [Clostridia bacterium]
MKKGVIIAGIVGVIAISGITLLGVNGRENKESDNVSYNTEIKGDMETQENVDSVKENGEELIYQFNEYIQNKDAEKMASLFNEKYTVVANKEYYDRKELTDKFNKAFSDESYKSYKITDVHKIVSKEEFNKYYKESSSVDYENSILKVAQIYGNETLIYVVDIEYNNSVSQDVVYITENNGKYVIERTTMWSFMISNKW